MDPDDYSFQDWSRANEETRRVWNSNAAFWNQRMDEGNDFVEYLIWPATERQLQLQPGERVLDIACGNGLSARRLAALGAVVVAIDFSEQMIQTARERTQGATDKIEYRVADATDETALRALGERDFDAALCQMALFDIATLDPLLNALAKLLRPGGRFVFSVLHPCFNNAHVTLSAGRHDNSGHLTTEYWLKLTGYLTPKITRGVAMDDQPEPHLYFDRPLETLLGACFQAGFSIDAMEERGFAADHPKGSHSLSWNGNFSEFLPVIVARARLSKE